MDCPDANTPHIVPATIPDSSKGEHEELVRQEKLCAQKKLCSGLEAILRKICPAEGETLDTPTSSWACYDLAMLYRHGPLGIRQPPSESVSYFTRACKQKHFRACTELGLL